MYAVIDIGSNTVRMVLYKLIDGEFRQMLGKKKSAGLIGYIDENNCMSPKGIGKAIEILREYLAVLESVDVEKTFVFATASLRNIGNTEQVVASIKKACGLDVRVLTGDEEAVFDYFGAFKSIDSPDGLMADIGGGSTELVFFSQREVVATFSLPVGSLNMYTTFVRDIVPSIFEITEIIEHVTGLLDLIELPDVFISTKALYGVGGTARASCRLSDELFDENMGYAGYECKRIKKMLKLVRNDRDRLASAIIETSPDRLHTLLPGMAVLQAISQYYKCERFSSTPYGVREGFILYLLEEGELNGG